MICDMCGSLDAIWKYTVAPVQGVVMLEGGGLGIKDMPDHMMLCDDCSGMVETDDKVGLQRKAVEKIVNETVHGDMTHLNKLDFGLMVKRSIEGFQKMFWEIKTGEREFVEQR